MPLVVAAKTKLANLARLHTVSPAGIPLAGAGGVQVLPPSELLKTPAANVPASIEPKGPLSTVCTEWLSLTGFSGSSSGPCAIGLHAPPLVAHSPSSVPA